MNKILCPVDFSDTSFNAIEFAVEIGKKFHSVVTLVHVFTEDDFNKIVAEEHVGKSFQELMSISKSKIKSLSEKICEEYAAGGLGKCDYHVQTGDLTDCMLTLIEEGQYDLIVMGTTGISHINGVFFGSNTEEVIEKAKIPVFCIPDTATFRGFNKIVYASDFMEEDRLAIQEVISFALLFDARISVLHINQGDDQKEYDDFVKELKSFIQYRKIGFVNKDFKEDVGLGIEEYMQEQDSDLLVVFRKQRSFFGSLFHKSLTKTLSYSTDKPFLVLKLENNN